MRVTRKVSILITILGSLLILGLVYWMLPAQRANAQCKNLSSCKNCHESQAQNPVNAKGAWHVDHANFDLCYACHGGARDATDKTQAHTGLILKLQDMPASCKQCHAADLDARFTKYAAALNISDTSSLQAAKQSSDALKGLSGFLGQQPAGVSVPTPTPPADTKTVVAAAVSSRPANTRANIILGSLLVLGVLGGGWYIAWNERRLRRENEQQRSWFVTQLRKEHWSPYAAGVLLGVTCILTVLMAQRTLGASSAIASISSTIVNEAAPAVAGNSMYFKFLMPPGFNWEIALLVGVFIGGMLGAISSGTFRLRWNDDPTWNKVFGAARWKRFVIGFLGAVILQYGAGIAGGCTSGLAISGGMLMAPSAFIFMAGMFISGILMAFLVYRRRY